MKRRGRRILLIAIVFFAAVLAVTVNRYRNASARLDEQLPDPNGYTELLAIEGDLTDLPNDVEDLSDAELVQFVDQHEAQLKAIREALRSTSAVPVFDEDTLEQNRFLHFKALWRLLDFEILNHRRAGRFDEAAETAVTLIRYGRAIENRGVLIHYLIGSSAQVVAARRIDALVPDLGDEKLKEVLAGMHELATSRESFDDIMERERRWMIHSGGLKGYIAMMILSKSIAPERSARFSAAAKALHDPMRKLAAFRVRLAIAAFTSENGRPPEAVAELIPKFIPKGPTDPATGTPLTLEQLSTIATP
jgi:hypothetical protein